MLAVFGIRFRFVPVQKIEDVLRTRQREAPMIVADAERVWSTAPVAPEEFFSIVEGQLFHSQANGDQYA